jgi:hypothetical protein
VYFQTRRMECKIYDAKILLEDHDFDTGSGFAPRKK